MPGAILDVRDMLCAQALALVAKAMRGVAAGERVWVRHNAEDVRRDLLAWAHGRAQAVDEADAETLVLTKSG